MSPKLNDYITGTWHLIKGKRTQDEQNLAAERKYIISPFVDCKNPLQVLDLANGYLRPQYTLLQTEGNHVYGIDIANRPETNWINFSYRLAQWIYRWHIGFKYAFHSLDNLVCGDVSTLPFKKNNFDLVTSIAAFEHFLDVPAVVNEIHRVLRSGSLAYIRIHPYTCPSGGHNLSLMEIPLTRIPRGVDAWDHLRKRKIPIRVPLNEWRISQYLDEFSRRFEILKHYCAMREGEHLLTPELKAELSDYSQDELTCGAYVIVARKPFN